MDWTDNYKAAMAQGKQPPASPIWKPIGEAARDLVMSIEQIDGYRVPVHRHFGMDHASELLDIENQNRVTREILREAMRVGEAEGRAQQARMNGQRDEAAQLQQEADSRKLELERASARRDQYKMYAYEPMTSMNPFNDFNW